MEMNKTEFNKIFNKINADTQDMAADIYVTHAKINKSKHTIEATLTCDAVITASTIAILKKAVLKAYDIADVIFKFTYPSEMLDEQAIEGIIDELRVRIPITNGSFMDCTSDFDMQNSALNIRLKNGGAEFLTGAGCAKEIEKIIQEWFGVQITTTLLGPSHEEIEQMLSHSLSAKCNEKAAAAKAYVPQEKPKQSSTQPQFRIRKNAGYNDDKVPIIREEGEVLMGKEIRDNVTPLCDVLEESEAVVWGEVFGFEAKVSKSGQTNIFTFNIADDTAAMPIKIIGRIDKTAFVTEKIKNGSLLLMRCTIAYDKFAHENVASPTDIQTIKRKVKTDSAPVKRVELHCHTKLSQVDGLIPPDALVKRAVAWGHKAVAVTDHGVLQAFPIVAEQKKKLKSDIKIVYGVEAYLADDTANAVVGNATMPFDGSFVVFDIETTGLSTNKDRITEIGAVKLINGMPVKRWQTFVNCGKHIPDKIRALTGISDDMLIGAPDEKTALTDFLAFCEDLPLIAHNASFDVGFILAAARRHDIEYDPTYIDTVPMCRALLPKLRSVSLDKAAEALSVSQQNHHRADDDAEVLSQIFLRLAKMLKADHNITDISQINGFLDGKIDPKKLKTFHQIILVKNQTGLKNLYKLVSIAHLDYIGKNPVIPKSILLKYREGLILGSACEAGQLYSAIVDGRSHEKLCELARFNDYLEIQPIGNNNFMLEKGIISDIEEIKEFNRTVVRLGEELNIPVVATCDAHFLDKQDSVFREIIQTGEKYPDADKQPPLYFRTTAEMLDEFEYLGADKAYEVVVKNTNLIADMCDDLKPIPDGSYPPNLEGSEEELRRIVYETAHSMYGDPLPEIVENRIDRELTSIIKNGFAVLYMIAQKLVAKSNSDGYYVGSRGSVGSSFIATMANITEVNPLAPHYRCLKCKHSEFFTDGSIADGFDLPDKDCPVCGAPMRGDGHDIPFETFLGFDGDKSPDIDLNFSGEYQPVAHKYVEELFGEDNVFRAGTISDIAEKTAFGYVKAYLEKHERVVSRAEEQRLAAGCAGVKKTSGQHPGGIIVIPREYDVFDFTPVQYPANKPECGVKTTHFAFKYLHDTVLKLDILGHVVPTLYRMLEDATGLNVDDLPLNDPNIYKLFTSPEPLGVTAEQLGMETGSLTLPEMGTKFVRDMLLDSRPQNFAELLQISGLSHGTDVWLGNAKDLIDNGVCTIKDVIGTRDNIMVYLLHKNLPPKEAFKIMEKVRKGKGLSPEDEALMKEHGVPDWYLDSCKKIKYMFPKAHAVAYVLQALRLGWFLIYRPLDYYAAYLTVRAGNFDAITMTKGREQLMELRAKILSNENRSQNDEATLDDIEVVNEIYARGFDFLPIDIYKSHATRFTVEDGKIRPPYTSLKGCGESAAVSITEKVAAYNKRGEKFLTVDEFTSKTGAPSNVVTMLQEAGAFGKMAITAQVSFFDDIQ